MLNALIDRLFVFCASLKLAVVSLFTIAAVLGTATFYEARFGTDAAQIMVYQSWWFAAMLGVLAVNIFSAAVIRFPWKRHQTGFVITHLGLLTLLFGCVIGFHRSVDGLLAAEEGESSQTVRLKREHFMLRYADHEARAQSWVRVSLLEEGAYPPLWRFALSPVLGSIERPTWPEGRVAKYAVSGPVVETLEQPVQVDVLDWYPAARAIDQWEPGAEGDGAAMQVVLEGELPGQAAAQQHNHDHAGHDHSAHGPADEQIIGSTWLHLEPGSDVATQQVGPMQVRLLRLDDDEAVGAFLAYDAEMPLPDGVRGMLEFAQTTSGRLYARRFTDRGLMWADEVNVDEAYEAFMTMQFRVKQYLPHARQIVRYEKLHLAPNEPGIPAARVRVRVGDELAHEMWLARDGVPRLVPLGRSGAAMSMVYGVDHLPLPFSIHVERFKRGVDPGTDNAASFASFVKVVGPDGAASSTTKIAMNHPLEHDGLTFYQSGFQPIPGGGMMTILAVNRDPGRPIKYLGSLLVVLGIFTMFYMRAYFFKAGGRRTDSATEPAATEPKAAATTTAAATAILAAALAIGMFSPEAQAQPVESDAAVSEHVHDHAAEDAARAAPRQSPDQLPEPFLQADTLEAMRHIAVMEGGRVKPLDTVARQTIRQITGREHFGPMRENAAGELEVVHKYDPVELLLAFMSDPARWSRIPMVRVDLLELREYLGMSAHHSHVAPITLSQHPEFRRRSMALFSEAGRAENEGVAFEPTRLEEAILDVARREGHFRGACRGGMLGMLPYPTDDTFFAWLDEQAASPQPVPAARHALFHWQAIPEEYVGQERREGFAERAGWLSLDALLATEPNQLPPSVRQRWTEAGSLWANALDQYQAHADADAAMMKLASRISDATGAVVAGNAMGREVFYNRMHPFRWAMGFYLLAAAVLLLAMMLRSAENEAESRSAAAAPKGASKAETAVYALGILTLVTAIGFNIFGFYLRIAISGWAPVTNMYETVIWVALVTALFGLAMELVYRWRVIALSAAIVAAVCALVADIMPPNLGAELKSLQPVLRDNFWLTTHVLTIVSSYAAFALALGLGNLALGLYIFAPSRTQMLRRLTLFIYRAIQLGVLLIAAGTILGGVWADVSWGRFWGWDPKEVWALIVLLIYLAILHGRFAGLVGPFGLAVGAVLGFVSVIMAWYGVNFVLGAGLHSYGFGAGGRPEVFTGVAVQLAFVGIAWWRRWASESARKSRNESQQPMAAADGV